MSKQHGIIPGRIGIKPLEGQLFMPEILQRPVGQFVTTTFMVTSDDGVYFQIIFCTGFFKHCINRLSLSDVGDDNCIRPESWKIQLVPIVCQTAVNSTPEFFPVASLAAKLSVFPKALFTVIAFLKITFRLQPFFDSFLDYRLHQVLPDLICPLTVEHLYRHDC